ncbi:hypothetical protein ABIA32_006682 [Streptacidiphilus sp. MAP12-20]|uniref:DUF7878 domain-containing protein n=1 Tax=Streptacidiphilus sp. MAP12-20 TaxID=3156299 RepID=UPI0035147A8D
MEITYGGINAKDLRHHSLADLLVHVEADLNIVDHEEVIYSERAFPVAELAREFARWLDLAAEPEVNFEFSSMSFDETGAIEISRVPSGWSVGSVFTPDRRSAPIAFVDLAATLREFIGRVLRDVEALGLDAESILP